MIHLHNAILLAMLIGGLGLVALMFDPRLWELLWDGFLAGYAAGGR